MQTNPKSHIIHYVGHINTNDPLYCVLQCNVRGPASIWALTVYKIMSCVSNCEHPDTKCESWIKYKKRLNRLILIFISFCLFQLNNFLTQQKLDVLNSVSTKDNEPRSESTTEDQNIHQCLCRESYSYSEKAYAAVWADLDKDCASH